MKILLTAVNAKYIHSNLAIYSLRAYADRYKKNIELAEFTINNYTDDILKNIYKKKPDVIAFSCYIWNVRMIYETAAELKKVLPDTDIWFGGPEVSYDAKTCLENHHYVKGIMAGEGEETFLELMEFYIEKNKQLKDIKGIVYRENEDIIINTQRDIMDLNKAPFPYEDIKELKNKIVYYETSRGCPYSCSYCLSSIDKKVRLKDIEIVKKDLLYFIENKIPQVKFVDRTFNCNHTHAIEIWKFIKENDNGITNFHFEISADILREDELELLGTMREGLVQLEIGVQSTNPKTLEAIRRKMDFERLSEIVERINSGKNIHQHLDLIAGLPFEDIKSFQKSFNDVYSLCPEQLQLGFLKVLKGSYMYEQSKKYNISYKQCPPYEVLFTEWLSYKDVLELKGIEEMVEVYYNSGQFNNTIKYLENYFDTPFRLYQELAEFYEKKGLDRISHNRMSRYYIIIDFFEYIIKNNTFNKLDKTSDALKQILLYDLYLRENLKSRPEFASDFEELKKKYYEFYMSDSMREKYLRAYAGYTYKQLSRLTHIEKFHIDIKETVKSGIKTTKEIFVLFDYNNRNTLNYEAHTEIIEEMSR